MLASNQSNLAWNNSTTLQTFWQQHYKRILIVVSLVIVGLYIYRKHIERRAQQADSADRGNPSIFQRPMLSSKRAVNTSQASSQYIYIPSPAMIPIRTKPKRETVIFGPDGADVPIVDHATTREPGFEVESQDATGLPSAASQQVVDTHIEQKQTQQELSAAAPNDASEAWTAAGAPPAVTVPAVVPPSSMSAGAQQLLDFAAYEEPSYGVLF